jgi:hypothetical protein
MPLVVLCDAGYPTPLVALCGVQVVVGVGDPNPLVASEGIATLERAGIEVIMAGASLRHRCDDGWQLRCCDNSCPIR